MWRAEADGEVVELGTSGLPLGLLSAAPFSVAHLDLEPGDLLCLYSDGITECEAPDDEQYGMERFIDSSREFIGVESIRARQADGVSMQLAYLAFDDDVPCECHGNEAVYQGDELVGLTTGGAYGHRVGYSLAFAYIRPELVTQGTVLRVQTALGNREAHVEMDAVYDPANEKLRG